MKSKVKITSQTQTIQTLTKKMLGKNKYAFVSFPKTVLLSLSASDGKGIPVQFVEDMKKSFSINDPAYMKAVPSSFVYSAEKDDELNLSIFNDESIYFNSSTLENYFHTNEIVFKSFVEFYVENNPFITVSFNEKKHVARVLGLSSAHIHVSYNNFYDKIDEICESIDKVKDVSDTVILDCPVLSAGLAHKIWENFNLSILDLGKVVSFSKTKSLDRAKFNGKKTYKN